MKCFRCQQDNSSDADFCRKCGTPVTDGPSYAELQRALTEALDQQTATSEILRVISSSPAAPEDDDPHFRSRHLRESTHRCGRVVGTLTIAIASGSLLGSIQKRSLSRRVSLTTQHGGAGSPWSWTRAPPLVEAVCGQGVDGDPRTAGDHGLLDFPARGCWHETTRGISLACRDPVAAGAARCSDVGAGATVADHAVCRRGGKLWRWNWHCRGSAARSRPAGHRRRWCEDVRPQAQAGGRGRPSAGADFGCAPA